ncbi:MAG: peroxide stress protein YaaA [Acidimicrobiales bacterium]|nr:peroxide stress protein YaaA [Acidimicrobiales bacterium]
MPLPLILLPPSEGKAHGGEGPPWENTGQSFPQLAESRREVIAALSEAMGEAPEARSKLLGVKGGRAVEATASNLAVSTAPTMVAMSRYTGVLYDALDYRSLPTEVRQGVDRQVVIFSGLWGAVRPTDPIPDYKLKMGAMMPGLGRLALFWKSILSATLAESAAGTVWDLLPNEHSAAWDPSVAARRIKVRFLDDVIRDGKRKMVTVSHWNKLLKGALVRHVVEHGVDEPEGLIDFTHPEGYEYDSSLTVVGNTTTEIALVARR